MSDTAVELPAPNNSFLRYLRELPSDGKWWKNNANSAVQWIIKFALIVAGVRFTGHGLIVNAVVTFSWDVGAFGANLWIWRKNGTGWKQSATKNFGLWPLMQCKNQGLTLLLSGLFGLPIEATKVVLVPEGFAMNPLMYYINDRYVFAETNWREIAAARLRLEACQATAASQMFLLRIGGM